MKIRAHETFSIRKGWIHKGVKNILVYPRLFTDKNINPCDILGIGTNMVKSLITLIGNSFNGQAFSKTSESTNVIVISKEDLQKVTKNKYEKLSKEIEKILFEEKGK